MQIPLVRFAIAFGSGLLIAGVGCAPMQPDHLSGNQNTAKREVTTGSSVEDALQRRQVQARDEPFYAELGDESASFSSDGHVDYSAGKLGDENASFSTDGHVDYPAGQLGNANVSFD